MPDFADLMQDERVQNVVHQVVTNPVFLHAMPNIAANPQLRSVCVCVCVCVCACVCVVCCVLCVCVCVCVSHRSNTKIR